MSAFQCSDALLNAILHFYRQTAGRMHNDLTIYTGTPAQKPLELGAWHEDKTWVKAMAVLYWENLRSLKARYKDDEKDAPFSARQYSYSLGTKPLSAVEALKACQCFDYQACETNDYSTTYAAKLVDSIRSHAISLLPGYDEAPWGGNESWERFQRKGKATLIVIRA